MSLIVGRGIGGGGGGELVGCDEGGDIDVMSSDGDRCRCVDELELGEGVSSGGGGGGSTK